MDLLYHRMNRKNPARRAVDEITIDIDEDEGFVSHGNFRRGDDLVKPQEKKDDSPSVHSNDGTEEDNQKNRDLVSNQDDLKNCSKCPENNRKMNLMS
jgi:hypothetical protein